MIALRVFAATAAVAAVLIVPSAAGAQTAAAAAASQPAPAAPQPTAGFQDGFFIQTANGDNRLLFGLVAQTDGRF
jgi:hypothetical protein